jgi:long-chain acyl-CoA synthetase
LTVASHTGSPTALRNIHSLVDMLAHSVAHHSAETLFLTKSDGAWHPTSYAAFEQQVNHLRGGMAALGVGPGDRVGIIANNCIEWAAAGYATYGLGAAFVPMYESQVDKEWAFIARDAGIKLLFVASPDVFQRVSRFSLAIPCLEHLVLLGGKGDAKVTYRSLSAAGERMPHRALHQAPSATACLMYTSGTTGDPKGVVLSHANILSNVAALLQVIPLSTEYRTLSFLPWAHAFGHTV